MTKLLLLSLALLTFTTPTPPVTGWASYYAEAPTVATLDYRVSIGDITHADLLWANAPVAVSDCGMIGDRVTVQIEDGPLMNAIVFDCAGADGTANWMAESNIVLELDFYTATAYGMIDRGALRVRMWE